MEFSICKGRQTLAILISLIMALTVFAIPQYSYAEDGQPVNLLTNPGFEADIWGDDDGWNKAPASWDNTTIAWAPNSSASVAPAEGNHYMNYWSGAAQEIWITQYFKLEPGTYVLSGSVQGASNTPYLYAKGDNGEAVTESITLTGWGTWDQGSLEFTAETADYYCVGLKLDLEDDGWGYIDDMKLIAKDGGTGEGDEPGVDPDKPTVKPSEADQKVAIEPVKGLSEDFIRGVDISSVISLENAGVKYYNNEGKEEDIFKIMADAGVNYVRVRIWNDPYDAEGNGYGGGNNNLETAKLIGARAADNGMKLLVDFHYSDFWASPQMQLVPKAWKGYTLEQKTQAISEFTAQCIRELNEAGADVGMVQIGNETSIKDTDGKPILTICGETNQDSVIQLLNAGCKTTKEIANELGLDIKTMIHLAGAPDSRNMTLADRLESYDVDYDVLGLSWYAYYNHGTLDHLRDDINTAKEKYNKPVVIAETSYPSTYDDSDGFGNLFSEVRYLDNKNGEKAKMTWTVNPQGQAESVRDLIEAVSSSGEGIGIFYWEPAWITVGNTYGLTGDAWQEQYAANVKLWEKYGCGWATDYAAEYSRNADKYGGGGSNWENQAMFDRYGRATDSLNVFKYIYTGSTSDIDYQKVTSYDRYQVNINSTMTTDEIWSAIWKDAVNCTYEDGTCKWVNVSSWINYEIDDESNTASLVNKLAKQKLGPTVIHGRLNDVNNTLVEMDVNLQPVLRYSLNGVSDVSNAPVTKKVVDYKVATAVAGAPVSSSKFFRGWNTSSKGTGTNYLPGKSVTLQKDTKLYAKWTSTYTAKNGIKYKVIGKNKVKAVSMTKNPKTVTVPSTITVAGVKYKVTSIGDYAFKKNTKCTKLVIGANVTSIGKYILDKTTKTCTVEVKATGLKKASTTLRSSKSKMTIKLPKKNFKAYSKMLKLSKLKGTIKVVKY